MESALDYHSAKALLDWHVDLGADEAIGDVPINRYETPKEAPKPKRAEAPAAPAQIQGPDPVAVARDMAGAAADLDALRAAITAFPHCDIKNGARNLVFSEGVPGARVMVIGDAPTREEDREGKPLVGPAGTLLDTMFGAIDHGRGHDDTPIYITSVLPWRAQTRDPDPKDVAMMLPFLARHVALAKPEILVLMGNQACEALLGQKGITKLRGTWTEALGLPTLPMLHPAYLLRTPIAKRDTWADLLDLQARLRG